MTIPRKTDKGFVVASLFMLRETRINPLTQIFSVLIFYTEGSTGLLRGEMR